MKPAPFRYFAPTSISECLDLLKQYGEDAKLLAGGQSLVPLMNFRLVKPAVIVDLNRVDGLAYIRRDDDVLHIGAMTRQRELERDPSVARDSPLLAEAIRYVGHPQIRNRGTVGGSIAHADPAAELPAVLLALNGSVKVTGPRGDRIVPASQFFLGYFTTALAAHEVLTEIQLPAGGQGEGWAVQEVARRHGDFALVGVACRVAMDGDGAISQAVAALFGVAATPLLAPGLTTLLGTRGTEADLLQVAQVVSVGLEPTSDIHASARYRKQVAGVLIKRCLAIACQRARGRAL